MKAQPGCVSCQIRLKVWLDPLPAFASIFQSGKTLLHPRQHVLQRSAVEEPSHRTDAGDARMVFCWGFLWRWGRGDEKQQQFCRFFSFKGWGLFQAGSSEQPLASLLA